MPDLGPTKSRSRAFAAVSVAVAVTAMVGRPPADAAGSPPSPLTVVTSRASVPSSGGSDAGASSQARVDRDGDTVFASTAPLSSADGDTASDVYLRTAGGTTRLISRTSNHHAANAASDEPAISVDGRFVAFRSAATDLAASGPAPAVGRTAVYLYDRNPDGAGLDVHPTMSMVSVTGEAHPVEANGDSDQPTVADAGDTAYVAFRSVAGNLRSGDINGVADVFVHFGTKTEGVSNGPDIGKPSGDPTIAATAKDIYVAFDSTDTQLVANDTNGVEDVFVTRIPQPSGSTETELVSVTSAGDPANGASSEPSITSAGGKIAFASMATNLASTDTNAASDVFVRDRSSKTTTLVSYSDSDPHRATTADATSDTPAISANGAWVAFESTSTNITAHDTNGFLDVFITDLVAPFAQLVSRRTSGAQGTGPSSAPGIAADGQWVAFASSASNLASGDGNGAADAFVSRRDGTAPHAPTATPDSAHPLNSTKWSAKGKITITLSGADGASTVESGIAGYSYAWNHTKTYSPRETENLAGKTVTTTLSTSSANYFHVRAVDRDGNWGPTKTIGPFKIDTFDPAVGAPHLSPDGLTVKPRVRVTWQPSDKGSGVQGVDIYLSTKTNTSGWSKFAAYKTGLSGSSYTIATRPGRDYQVRVRVHDKAGNSTFRDATRSSTTEIFGTPTPASAYSTPSGWTVKSGSAYYGGRAWVTSTKGRKVTFSHINVPAHGANAAVGEELGFVMTTCPTCGEVKIIGSAPGEGSHSFTVNLHSATTHPSVIVAREFGHDGNLPGLYPTTATIEVISGHKPVEIAGFGSVMTPQCGCI
jgi:hypothetical protein